MDNPEHQELTPTEKRLCDRKPKKIVKTRSGQRFTTHLGAPGETYLEGMIFVSDVPHVFLADHFVLNAPGQTLIEATNVNVLMMHGINSGGRWHPKSQELQQKGITVEDIVNGLVESGQAIDVLFVCNPESSSGVRVNPFSEKYRTPMIYMTKGDSEGSASLNETTGEITLRMNVNSPNDIEYRKWKNKGRVRVVQQT